MNAFFNEIRSVNTMPFNIRLSRLKAFKNTGLADAGSL